MRGAVDEKRGQRLRRLLEEQGWDVADLARAAGVDPSQIYRWLKGEPISSRALGRLAPVLGTSRAYIVTGREPDGADSADRVIARIEEAERRVLEAIDRLIEALLTERLLHLTPREADAPTRSRSRRSRRVRGSGG